MFSTENLTNQVFGKLLVLGRSDRQSLHKKRYWLCRCACGKELTVDTARLKGGICRTCGCSHIKADIAERELFRRYRDSAVVSEREFTLSLEEFKSLIQQDCYYCGDKPERKYKSKRGVLIYYNGLDRVDNTQGYVFTNIVPCCRSCNFAKNTSDQLAFLNRSAAVALKHKPAWQENVRTVCNCISLITQLLTIYLVLHFRR
jgi:hypothetical protein